MNHNMLMMKNRCWRVDGCPCRATMGNVSVLPERIDADTVRRAAIVRHPDSRVCESAFA